MTKLDYRNLIAIVVGLGVAFKIWPSALSPVLWSRPNALPSLQGVLGPNKALSHATRISNGQFAGPESIAFEKTGNAFASLNDGTVGYFSKEGELIKKVFFTGGFLQSSNRVVDGGNRNGLSSDTEDFQRQCNEKALSGELAWDTAGERACGRPLGLRLKKKGWKHLKLFIVDAYHGVFVLDTVTLQAEHMITPETPITATGGSLPDPTALLTPMFYNDLDLTEKGVILLTDSSHRYTRSENRREVLDGAPNGRILSFDPLTAKLTVLLCGLHFPNGIQVMPTGDVVVAELGRFRLLNIDVSHNDLQQGDGAADCSESGYLERILAHQSTHANKDWNDPVSVFYDSLPGIVDNIRLGSNGDGLLYVGLGGKSSMPFSLLWTAFQSIVLREIIGKFVSMRWIEMMIPSYGLVIVLRVLASPSPLHGEVVRSLHDPTGESVSWISHADVNPTTGALWLGSHSNPYLGILQQSDKSR